MAPRIGFVLGHSEKIIRMWRHNSYTNQGNFTELRQGGHASSFIGMTRVYVKEQQSINATAKGRPNMTGPKFCSWVNSHLLPGAELPPGCPQQIQPRIAIKWLDHLGFVNSRTKKAFTLKGMSVTML